MVNPVLHYIITLKENGMYHVPMCKVCGEHEVGTWHGSTEYCSERCEDVAFQEMRAGEYDAAGDGWGYDDCEAMMSFNASEYMEEV